MGSDLYMDPPAPPPLDEQIRYLIESRDEAWTENHKLQAEVRELKEQIEALKKAFKES